MNNFILTMRSCKHYHTNGIAWDYVNQRWLFVLFGSVDVILKFKEFKDCAFYTFNEFKENEKI